MKNNKNSEPMVILTLPLEIADGLKPLKKSKFQNKPIDVWDKSEISKRQLPVQLGAGEIASFEGVVIIMVCLAMSKIIGGALEEMGKDFYHLIKKALSVAINNALSEQNYNSASGHVELKLSLRGGTMCFCLPIEPTDTDSCIYTDEQLKTAIKQVKWIVVRDCILVLAWPGRRFNVTRNYGYNKQSGKWKWFLISHEHH